MKTKILFAASVTAAVSLLAADPSPKDDVTSAAKKLGQQNNYSWKTTIEFGGFPPSSSDGKANQEGIVWLSMKFGDNTTEAYLKAGKGAVKRNDEAWQSLAELMGGDGQQGGGRFIGRILQNYKAPAVEAPNVAGKTKEMKKEGDTYSGDLTEEGAKDLLSFGGRGGGGPEPTDAKGSVKFWIKDGAVSKYELKLQGKMNFNGEDRDVSRTTNVEIKDVGTTKLEVPEDAKKKLS